MLDTLDLMDVQRQREDHQERADRRRAKGIWAWILAILLPINFIAVSIVVFFLYQSETVFWASLVIALGLLATPVGIWLFYYYYSHQRQIIEASDRICVLLPELPQAARPFSYGLLRPLMAVALLTTSVLFTALLLFSLLNLFSQFFLGAVIIMTPFLLWLDLLLGYTFLSLLRPSRFAAEVRPHRLRHAVGLLLVPCGLLIIVPLILDRVGLFNLSLGIAYLAGLYIMMVMAVPAWAKGPAKQGDYDVSLHRLGWLRTVLPYHVNYVMWQGALFQMVGRFEEAEKSYREVLAQPHEPRVQLIILSMLASVYANQGRVDDGIRLAQLGVELEPRSSVPLMVLAEIYLLFVDQPARAVALLDLARKTMRIMTNGARCPIKHELTIFCKHGDMPNKVAMPKPMLSLNWPSVNQRPLIAQHRRLMLMQKGRCYAYAGI